MAAGSAAIEPWDQYIRPKMLRERETMPALQSVRMFVHLVFDFVSAAGTAVSVSISVAVHKHVFCACITGRDSVDT